jgi:trans-aconitate methyltransferase
MPEMSDHWSKVYATKSPDAVSWYQKNPTPSLDALDRHGAEPSQSVIDIGGGASGLAGKLIERGWRDVTVLDIADSALEAARREIGPAADKVSWLVADITAWTPARRYDIWHDRAVFHFLTEPAARDAYREALDKGLSPGGLLIIATFAPEGPERCSGLPVRRYDAETLAAELGPAFRLIEEWREQHDTPGGQTQLFNWCVFRRLERA